MEKLKLLLARIGVDMSKVTDESTESELQQMLFDAMAKNKEFETTHIQPKINEHKTGTEKSIIGKLKKEFKGLGVELSEDEVDVVNMTKTLNEHLKKEYSKGDKDKVEELQKLQTKLRATELKIDELNVNKEEEINSLKTTHEGEIQKVYRSASSMQEFLQLNLSDSARKNAKTFHNALLSELDSAYDFKEEDGKQIAYKKGGESPVFKEGSTEKLSYKDLLISKASELELVKVTDVGGNGDPNRGGGKQGGSGKADPEIYNPYDD